MAEGNTNAFKHAGVNVIIDQEMDELCEQTAGLYQEETFHMSVMKKRIIKNTSAVAQGIVSEPPEYPDDGLKSIKGTNDDKDDDFYSVASYTPNTASTTNILISGIIGTDKMGSTYSPQKFIYVYDKNNKRHHEIAMESIAKGVKEWNSIEGCSANSFTFTMNDTNFPVITALSGISRGFMGGAINEIKSPIDAEKKKKKVQKEEAGAKLDGK